MINSQFFGMLMSPFDEGVINLQPIGGLPLFQRFPDDACDEESGEGWRAQIMSESQGVVSVKENRFPTKHWPLDAVLSWTPIK